MTEDVNKLAALSLQRPSRVAMPSADRIVAGLRQVVGNSFGECVR